MSLSLITTVRALPSVSLLARRFAGQNVRLQRGQAANGTQYGPLTDGPDWSYAGMDGVMEAPETRAQRRRRLRSARQEARVAMLLGELKLGLETESGRATERVRWTTQNQPAEPVDLRELVEADNTTKQPPSE